MVIYVALFRGINVGGKNRVKMADMKGMFSDLQLSRVQTYAQSGNVLFESDEGEASLRKKIEERSKEALGFPALVVLRKAAELHQLIRDLPFSTDAIQRAEAVLEVEHLYVALLTQPPRTDAWLSLKALVDQKDECQVVGRDVYLLMAQGIRRSRAASNMDRLRVPFTVRNWNTLQKLDELARAMSD